MAKRLMITAAEVLQDTSLEANIEANRIRPAIIAAQEIHAQQILGSALYDALYAKRTVQGTWTGLTTAETTLVTDYLTDVIRYYSEFEYMKSAAYSVDNAGVVKNFSDNSTPASRQEIKDQIADAESRADFHRMKMDKWLCDNYNEFPEYISTDQIIPPRRGGRVRHIYTGKR